MIFQTQNQLNCIFIFLFFGIAIGVFSIFYFLFFAEKIQKKLIKSLIDIVFYSFFGVFFIFLINFFNIGYFSFSLLSSYIVGYKWIKFSLKNLVVILEQKWYTRINNLLKKRKPKTNDRSKES